MSTVLFKQFSISKNTQSFYYFSSILIFYNVINLEKNAEEALQPFKVE